MSHYNTRNDVRSSLIHKQETRTKSKEFQEKCVMIHFDFSFPHFAQLHTPSCGFPAFF